MVKLPTNFELLAHQVHQDLVVRNSQLIDNLDRYWCLPHTILSLEHEPELPCAELFFEIVDLAYVVYAFEISRVHERHCLFDTQSFLLLEPFLELFGRARHCVAAHNRNLKFFFLTFIAAEVLRSFRIFFFCFCRR